MEDKRWPESGDFAVCTVINVADFGAYLTLDEYGGKEGYIHISEVKAGWVKYIRDYIREGQKVVCKVLKVNPARRQIDLSLKDVNEHQKRAKIQDWKNEQKAIRWLNFVAKELTIDESIMQTIYAEFYDYFGNLYGAFEYAATEGISTFDEVKIDGNIAEFIVKVAAENIKLPFVNITGFVDLTCYLPNGIDIIKKALKRSSTIKGEGVEIEVGYVGAPRYRIKVTAPEYKTAESYLKKVADVIINSIEKNDGIGTFHRHIE